MNETTLKMLARIVAVILMFLGVLYCFSAIAVAFGTAVVGVGSNMAADVGKSVGDFPYLYALGGSVVILIFGAFVLVLGVSLWMLKKWTPIGLYIFGAINIISSLTNGLVPQAITSIIFSVFIIALGYFLSTKGQGLLKK